MVYDVHP
jgi:hypothetical protein